MFTFFLRGDPARGHRSAGGRAHLRSDAGTSLGSDTIDRSGGGTAGDGSGRVSWRDAALFTGAGSAAARRGASRGAS